MICTEPSKSEYCPFQPVDCKSCKYCQADWEDELSKVHQCPQSQDSLTDQIQRARVILNKFGLYDVADYLRPKEER